MSKRKKIIIAVAVLLVMVLAAVLIIRANRPEPVAGAKTLAIEVVHADGSKKELTVHTDAENLRAALESEGLIAGEESEYGLFVKTVDGETADDSKQQWWAVSKDGQMLDTGVDTTMISDGEHYEFTLTTGW